MFLHFFIGIRRCRHEMVFKKKGSENANAIVYVIHNENESIIQCETKGSTEKRAKQDARKNTRIQRAPGLA